MPATLSPLPSRVTAPLPRHLADRHVGDVGDEDRDAVDRGDDDPLQVLDPGGEAQPADGEALRAVLDEAAGEGRVVLREGRHDLPEREAEAVQLARVDEDVELLRLAAPGVDLRDAAHGAQARADVPVLQRLLRHRVGDVPLDEVLVDLAEGGRHRAERRLGPLRGGERARRSPARPRAAGAK